MSQTLLISLNGVVGGKSCLSECRSWTICHTCCLREMTAKLSLGRHTVFVRPGVAAAALPLLPSLPLSSSKPHFTFPHYSLSISTRGLHGKGRHKHRVVQVRFN